MEYDDLDKEQLLEIITVLNQTVRLSNKSPSDIIETHFRNKSKPVKQGFIKENMFEITESLYGIISETELNQAYNEFKKVRIKTGCRFIAFVNANDPNILDWYDDNNLGISVCQEWADKYLENIGPIKPKLTLV